MEQYADVIIDPQGNVVVGARVSILDSQGAPAQIFGSNNQNSSINNPILTGSLGEFAFFARNGRYRIGDVSVGGRVFQTGYREFILNDPDDGAGGLPGRVGALESSVEQLDIEAEAATQALDALQLPDYAALRAYKGPRKSVYVTGAGIAGMFVRDDTDTVSADNGGTVIVASGKRFKRVFEVATPSMFSIPHVSSGVDYTAQLQALLDTRCFKFPAGFQASCRTLYPRSNSVGDFGDAKLTLMGNQPAGTQVVVLGDASGYKCENSLFYGGVFDGNRTNNTATGNPGTISGGDGGMHGIQVHNAENVVWHGARAINCGTDSVIVWQKTAIEPTGATKIANVHFHNFVCDGSGRQGVSVIACDDMHFYNLRASNTGLGAGAKAPKSGIDIEGNNASDNVTVYFHGATVSEGNASRAVMVHNPGAVYNITFDTLICRNSLAADMQVSLYTAAGSAVNNFRANRIDISGSVLYAFRALSYTATTETPVNNIIVNEMKGDKPMGFSSRSVLNIGSIDTTGATNLPSSASVEFTGSCKGTVGRIDAYNTSGASNGYCALFNGTGMMTIERLYTNGARGIHMDGGSNKTIREVVLDGAMVSSGIRTFNAVNNKLNVVVVGTVASDRAVRLDGASNDNDIATHWPNATLGAIYVEGSRNRISVRNNRAVGDSTVTYIAGANENLLHSSHIKGATNAGMISDAGTGNLVLGCFPKTINTP